MKQAIPGDNEFTILEGQIEWTGRIKCGGRRSLHSLGGGNQTSKNPSKAKLLNFPTRCLHG
jgi:hypothetical protein